MCGSDPPPAPTSRDVYRDAAPFLAAMMMSSAGNSYGIGGSTQRGRFDEEGNWDPFDPGDVGMRNALARAQNGDYSALSYIWDSMSDVRQIEDPEQAALRDAGRETQTMQNQLGQMILGQLLGGDIPLSGFSNEITPPMGFTPWQDTEANPFPTYQPPAPTHWDNWAIPLEAISLGSPYGRYETHPNRGD